jgi:hypothetical protein
MLEMPGYIWILLISLNTLGATLMVHEFINSGGAGNFILGFMNCFAIVLCAKRLIED